MTHVSMQRRVETFLNGTESKQCPAHCTQTILSCPREGSLNPVSSTAHSGALIGGEQRKGDEEDLGVRNSNREGGASVDRAACAHGQSCHSLASFRLNFTLHLHCSGLFALLSLSAENCARLRIHRTFFSASLDRASDKRKFVRFVNTNS